MKKSLTRLAAGVAAAGVIGAGSLVAAPEAQAAGPGDLMIVGGVSCTFKPWGPNWNSGPVWQMKRWLGVKNIGGTTMHDVTVTEFGGATKRVPALAEKHASKAGAVKRKTGSGELLPGQTYIAVTNQWTGCWPASISGYTIGREVENPFNNVGYWQNVKRQNKPAAPANPATQN